MSARFRARAKGERRMFVGHPGVRFGETSATTPSVRFERKAAGLSGGTQSSVGFIIP